MKKSLLLLFLLIEIVANAQNLRCKDFKKGTFIVQITSPYEMKFKVIRNGNKQTETIIEIPEEFKNIIKDNDTVNEKVEWIDDCSYRLTYDESIEKLDKYQKAINDANGILVELIKIEGNCFYYKSTQKSKAGDIVSNGTICKE